MNWRQRFRGWMLLLSRCYCWCLLLAVAIVGCGDVGARRSFDVFNANSQN